MTGIKKVVIFFCLLVLPLISHAEVEPSNLQQQKEFTQQQLIFSKQRADALNRTVRKLNKEKVMLWQNQPTEMVTDADIQSCQLISVNIKSYIDNNTIAIQNTRASLQSSNQVWLSIKEQNLSSAQEVKDRLQLNEIINLQNKHLEVLRRTEDLLEDYDQLWRSRCQQLQSIYDNQFQKPISNIVAVTNLKIQQQELSKQLAELPLHSDDPSVQFQVFALQEEWASLQVSLFIEDLKSRFRPTINLNSEMLTVIELTQQLKQTKNLLEQIGQTLHFVDRKIHFIEKNKELFANITTSEQQSFTNLINEYKNKYNDLLNLQTAATNYNTQLNEIHRKQFFIRQSLPGLSWAAWNEVFEQMLVIPQYTGHWLQNMATQIFYGLKILTTLDWYYFVIILLALIPIWFLLRRVLLLWLRLLEMKSKRFSNQILSLLLYLIRCNLGLLLVGLSSTGLLLILNLELTLWILLWGILLSYRLIVTIFKLWLLDRELEQIKKPISFYKKIDWVWGLTCLSIALVVLTHVFPVAYPVRVFFNKILMLFLVILSLLLLKAAPFIPQALQKFLGFKRPYIVRVMTILCMLIPIAILSNAIIGLIGYAELAWTISKYQVVALLILALYLIIRGLLIDLMDLIYGGLVKHFKGGWVWGEAFIRPFDRLLRIVLFVFMIWTFVQLSGLAQNPTFIAFWKKMMKIQLYAGPGAKVTIPWLFGLAIFVTVLYWLGKWSREFAFRLLFKRARDIGVQHSLSIFTQYAVVIIGVFVGLKIFGINLAGLTVIVAAFVAGVGFGLRDIIANFLSGILLLVERPFRTGDTVTVGTYEGEVIGTGMRSLKVRTWDHMEVIIPNSDMFTKPFVNWTHQDKIVRGIIHIKVHTVDDPHMIRHLILNILRKIPTVVEHPKPEVYMIEMNDALMEIEIQFYVNLQHGSRDRTRSEILFAIRDSFKEHGIKSPHHQYDIHILPDEKSATDH